MSADHECPKKTACQTIIDSGPFGLSPSTRQVETKQNSISILYALHHSEIPNA